MGVRKEDQVVIGSELMSIAILKEQRNLLTLITEFKKKYFIFMFLDSFIKSYYKNDFY